MDGQALYKQTNGTGALEREKGPGEKAGEDRGRG